MPSTPTSRFAATMQCRCLAARRRARAVTRHFDEYLRPHGLRSTQFSILAALSLTGPIPLGELADLLGLERTTLSRSAVLLQQRGWIDSAPAPDAREHRLALADAGYQVLERAYPSWEEAQAYTERDEAAQASDERSEAEGDAV